MEIKEKSTFVLLPAEDDSGDIAMKAGGDETIQLPGRVGGDGGFPPRGDGGLAPQWREWLTKHSVWLTEAWNEYCKSERERQQTILEPSMENTKAFLEDCGLDPHAPIAKWSPLLHDLVPSMPSSEARTKAREILHEVMRYRDVCIGGNLELLRVANYLHPREYQSDYDDVTLDTMTESRLFQSADPKVARTFVPAHCVGRSRGPLRGPAVPGSKEDARGTKRKAEKEVDDQKEQDGYGRLWLERQLQIMDKTIIETRVFCHQQLEDEWKLLNTPAAGALSTPLRSPVTEGKGPNAEGGPQQPEPVVEAAGGGSQRPYSAMPPAAAVEANYLPELLRQWTLHQVQVRMKHLQQAHRRWMRRAQPWLECVAPGSHHVKRHVELSRRLEALVFVDTQDALRVAARDRARHWQMVLEQLKGRPDVEQQWNAMRRQEEDRILEHLETSSEFKQIERGYEQQREWHREWNAAYAPTAYGTCNRPPQRVDEKGAKGQANKVSPPPEDVALTENPLAWKRLRQDVITFFEQHWFPAAAKLEEPLQVHCVGQPPSHECFLQRMGWTRPPHIVAHADQVAAGCPSENKVPTFAEWLEWLDHVTALLAFHGGLVPPTPTPTA